MYNCGVQKVGRTYKLVKKLTVIFVQFVCVFVWLFESIEIPHCFFFNEFLDEKNERNLQIQQHKMSKTQNIVPTTQKKILVNIAF